MFTCALPRHSEDLSHLLQELTGPHLALSPYSVKSPYLGVNKRVIPSQLEQRQTSGVQNISKMILDALAIYNKGPQPPGLPGGSDGRESPHNAGDPSLGLGRVGKIPWKRAWQPTPVLVPGEFHGQRSPATVHGVAESWTRLSE